jgi:hypothetical protein
LGQRCRSPFRRVGAGIVLTRKSKPAVVALAGSNGAGSLRLGLSSFGTRSGSRSLSTPM